MTSSSFPPTNKPSPAWQVGAIIVGLAIVAYRSSVGTPSPVLERNPCIASLWKHDRLKLHLSKSLCELPLMGFADDYPKYPPKEEFLSYMEQYESRVNRLEMFKGSVIHTRRYKSGKSFEGEKVLVVGCGNSRMDVSLDLCWQSWHNAILSMVVLNEVHLLHIEIFGISTFGVATALLKRMPVKFVEKLLLSMSNTIQGDTDKWGLRLPKIGPIELKNNAGNTAVLNVGALAQIISGTVKPSVATTDTSCESVATTSPHLNQLNPQSRHPRRDANSPAGLLAIAEETLAEFLSKATGTAVECVQMVGMKPEGLDSIGIIVDCGVEAYSAASLQAGPYAVPGLRPKTGFMGGQIVLPLAHTLENEEVMRLEGHGFGHDDMVLPRDLYMLQLCSGLDESSLGTCAKLVFAPINESFSDDAPLLPSGFRVIPLDTKMDNSGGNQTLYLASSLEVRSGSGGRATRAVSYSSCPSSCRSVRSVLTIAFQFSYESSMCDNLAAMARQYVRFPTGADLVIAMDSQGSDNVLKQLWHHSDAIVCCSLKAAPVFTFANQAGLDKLETTLKCSPGYFT